MAIRADNRGKSPGFTSPRSGLATQNSVSLEIEPQPTILPGSCRENMRTRSANTIEKVGRELLDAEQHLLHAGRYVASLHRVRREEVANGHLITLQGDDGV
mmetsp:Transcript_11373/g.18156  ORF Transcript_11373/g.18156 Transcript_11373/m.18156 type:complete len:101 (+) Transcript_11373:2473-2775(+)